ncbi:DNA repair protein RadC [Sphingomonas rubra]|uniref:DNA repair protein RadC n=1 Tax=Sphingomonas rubra TaxID=634430 RepID=A0A1I5UGV9_9SPHN|nr:DNA repair protein RadC [Sphingomonas rubra]
MADADPNDLNGHRARLRGRLLAAGEPGQGLLDHELIEYLLMLVIPRINTKPIAKALLREFGGIGGLLAADAAALRRVDGVGEHAAAAIKIAQAAALRMIRGQVAERPVLANWQALLDYLRANMAHGGVERFRVLHLNNRKPVVSNYAAPA